jgi:hypothetical protein
LSSTSTSAYTDIDVAATGVFTAVGTIKSKSTANDAPLYATFPHGGFTIITTSNGHQTQSGNPKTCLYTFGMTGGKFRVEDGTGVYKGISGTGTVNLSGKATGPRLADGKCNTANNAQPVSMTQTGHATAQLKF